MNSAHSKVAPSEQAGPTPAAPQQVADPADLPDSPEGSPTAIPVGTGNVSGARLSGPARAKGRGLDGSGELQSVFTKVLLSVVGAYGATGSVTVTVIAAIIAVLVTAVVARRG